MNRSLNHYIFLNKKLGRKELSFFFLFTVFFASGLLNTAENFDHLTLISLLGILIWLLFFEIELVFKYFYIIITALWSLIDVYYLENYTVYIPNLQKLSSHHDGSFFVVSAGFFVFILALLAADNLFFNKHLSSKNETNSEVKKSLYSVITFFAYVALVLFIIEAVAHGYFASGANSRYELLSNSGLLSIRYYFYLQLLIPIIAIYSYLKKNSVIIYLFGMLFISYLLLIGNKFGAILLVIYYCVITFFFIEKQSDLKLKHDAKKGIAFVGLMAGILAAYSFFQMLYEHGNFAGAFLQFSDRVLSGQGDVWWSIYATYATSEMHFTEFANEFSALAITPLNQLDYNFAIYKMMNLVAPQQVLEIYAQDSIRFSSSTDASLFYYFGFVGLLCGKAFLGVITAAVVNGVIISCSHLNGFSSVVYMLLLSFVLRVNSMSEFYLLLTPTAIACYIFLACSSALSNKSNNVKTNL